MSVLINSTSITLENKTKYLIEITCDTDQDESFHVIATDDIIKEREEPNNVIQSIFEYLYGSKLKKVIINLKPNHTNTLKINSKSQLEFNYEAKVKNSSEHLSGYLPISTEYQGETLNVVYSERKGLWKDENGNVVIVGTTKPKKQEVIIQAEITDSLKNTVHIDEYNPALCQLLVKEV